MPEQYNINSIVNSNQGHLLSNVAVQAYDRD